MAGDEPTANRSLKERALEEAPIGITISDPDRPDNPLIYVNDSFEELTGYPREETLGRNCRFLQGEDSDPEAIAEMREAIDEERPVSVELRNYRKDGEEFWNKVDIAPLRDDDGTVTNYVGFQTDITARKRAEFEVKRRIEEVEREREKLDHLLDRIEGLLQDVTGVLVRATSREEIEERVCRRLTAADAYAGAWIGERKPGTDRLVPTAWAGDVSEDELETELGENETPPVRAAARRTVQVVTDVDGPPDGAGSGETARSTAAIPLVRGDVVYGVLTVYADRPSALDQRETTVLTSIGRAITTALSALESKRVLTADNAIELTFAIHDEGLFFVRLSAEEDCQLSYEGSIDRAGNLAMFFTVEGVSPARIRDLAEEWTDVERITVVTEHDGSSLVEFRLARSSIVAELADRGARTLEITATDGRGRIRVELPQEAEPRAVADRLSERYANVDLVSYREYTRPPRTKGEYLRSVEEALTDRQLTALQKAYVGGYFDRPRRVTGDELAASMDITRSTFHQHLQAAQRKLLAEFFER